MFFQAKDGSKIVYELAGVRTSASVPLIVWGHGWGQNRQAFMPMIQSLSHCAHLLIDFPGFGESPVPETPWSVDDYTDAVAGLIASHKGGQLLWVGHSFGGRVGMKLAVHYPHLVNGLFLVGSHGLKRKRGLFEKLSIKIRITTYKLLKFLAPLTKQSLEELRSKFGSADYRSAGALRPTFMKVIADDLTPDVPRIQCPVRLIYGENDNETPPEMGQRLARLIPHAQFTLMPGLDHYTVLTTGRHLVLKQLSQFLENFK